MGFKKHNAPPPRGTIGPRIMCLSRLIRQKFNEAAAEQGLFSGQQDIIMLIVEQEGITLSKLAEKLEVSTATASVSVKRMEKAGFIVKKQDKNDARSDTLAVLSIRMTRLQARLMRSQTKTYASNICPSKRMPSRGGSDVLRKKSTLPESSFI